MAINPQVEITELNQFHDAIKNLNYEAMVAILERSAVGKLLINTPNSEGDAALIIIFKTSVDTVLKKESENSGMIQIGDNEKRNNEKGNNEKRDNHALKEAKLNIIKALVRVLDADVNQKGGPSSKHGTALHVAISTAISKEIFDHNDFEALYILLDNHERMVNGKRLLLDFNVYDNEGNSPLSLALLYCMKHNIEHSHYFKLSFDKEWDHQPVNRTPWLKTLLLETDLSHPKSNHLFLARGKILEFMLLRGGIEFIERPNLKGQTPLIDALLKIDFDKAILLLQAGAEWRSALKIAKELKELKEHKDNGKVMTAIKHSYVLEPCLNPSYLQSIANTIEYEYLHKHESDRYQSKKRYELGGFFLLNSKETEKFTLNTCDHLLLQRETVLSLIQNDKVQNAEKFSQETLRKLVVNSGSILRKFNMTEENFIKWIQEKDPIKGAQIRRQVEDAIESCVLALKPRIVFQLCRLLKPRNPDVLFDQAIYFKTKHLFALKETELDCPLPPTLRALVLEYCKWVPELPKVAGFVFDADLEGQYHNFNQLYPYILKNAEFLNELLFRYRTNAFTILECFSGEKLIGAEKEWKPEHALLYLKRLKSEYDAIMPKKSSDTADVSAEVYQESENRNKKRLTSI